MQRQLRKVTRVCKSIQNRRTTYYIDCQDGYSALAVFEERFCGYVTVASDAWETSWLDLLVVTGVTKARAIRAVQERYNSTECERLFWG